VMDMKQALQAAEQRKKRGEIRFLTHNMWGLYVPYSAPDKQERIQLFIPHLREFDVVVLQEIWVLRTLIKDVGVKLRQTLLDAAKAAGLKYQALGVKGNFVFGQGSGLIVLSRYPLSYKNAIQFSTWGWKEVVNCKGAVYVSLQFQGHDIHLVTAHLDAHKAQIRRSQLFELTRLLPDCVRIRTFGRLPYMCMCMCMCSFRMFGSLCVRFGVCMYMCVFLKMEIIRRMQDVC